MDALRYWPETNKDALEYNNIISIEVVDDVTDEPLTLADAKRHLRVDFTDEDVYIEQLIKETREEIEEELKIALAEKTIKAEIRNELGYIRLPYWSGVGTIVEVTDFEGDQETNYTINNGILETRFSTTVFVEYTTGFTTIPNKYLRMIKERLAFNYANRGDEKKVNNNGVWLA